MILHYKELEHQLNIILDGLERDCDPSEKSGYLPIGELIVGARQDVECGAWDIAWASIDSFFNEYRGEQRVYSLDIEESVLKVWTHFQELKIEWIKSHSI